MGVSVPLPIRLAALAALLAPAAAHAQPYCANFNNGERDCGIPTMEMCQQSISGIGGYCGPDQSGQIPPNFLQRRMQQNLDSGQPALHPPDPRQSQPGGLNWMPPPPEESGRR
jgi:hypothetical protein